MGEELLKLLIILVTELPPPPGAPYLAAQLRREMVHKLAHQPASRSELVDCAELTFAPALGPLPPAMSRLRSLPLLTLIPWSLAGDLGQAPDLVPGRSRPSPTAHDLAECRGGATDASRWDGCANAIDSLQTQVLQLSSAVSQLQADLASSQECTPPPRASSSGMGFPRSYKIKEMTSMQRATSGSVAAYLLQVNVVRRAAHLRV